jgi:hypothetical protein
MMDHYQVMLSSSHQRINSDTNHCYQWSPSHFTITNNPSFSKMVSQSHGCNARLLYYPLLCLSSFLCVPVGNELLLECVNSRLGIDRDTRIEARLSKLVLYRSSTPPESTTTIDTDISNGKVRCYTQATRVC